MTKGFVAQKKNFLFTNKLGSHKQDKKVETGEAFLQLMKEDEFGLT